MMEGAGRVLIPPAKQPELQGVEGVKGSGAADSDRGSSESSDLSTARGRAGLSSRKALQKRIDYAQVQPSPSATHILNMTSLALVKTFSAFFRQELVARGEDERPPLTAEGVEQLLDLLSKVPPCIRRCDFA